MSRADTRAASAGLPRAASASCSWGCAERRAPRAVRRLWANAARAMAGGPMTHSNWRVRRMPVSSGSGRAVAAPSIRSLVEEKGAKVAVANPKRVEHGGDGGKTTSEIGTHPVERFGALAQ
eukprot:7090950-Prymnesium_polylepis.2